MESLMGDVDSNVIPTKRNTGFVEPLSTQRNTTLPHPDHVEAASETDEDLNRSTGHPDNVGMGAKIKGEIMVIEGKVLHNRRLVEEGRAIKLGIPLEGK
jgi:hypothetical protein